MKMKKRLARGQRPTAIIGNSGLATPGEMATSIIIMIISTLIVTCLIFGLTIAYAEPKRITSAEQQEAARQKKERKQAIKAEIPAYSTIEQQIDAANGVAEIKAILKKLARVVTLQTEGE